MEALAISAANLNTIEKNLGDVAKELSGVIVNVSDVNNQVNKVEEKVATLNDEVKNLVKEIRETTIITNARQSIMYNNEQIEKKYGYYDQVRRTTESLIDAIENSNIRIKSLIELKQELILRNPNYWLSNALAAITLWLLNDKNDTEKELKNALKKDEKKTSLFFCLINLKLGRYQTSINWLNKYLSTQNPTKLDKDFVTILDLVATGAFGDQAKKAVLSKIGIWVTNLNGELAIQDKQKNIWLNFIKEHEETEIRMPQLELFSKDVNVLKENLAITSSYLNILNNFKNITYQSSSNKEIDHIISELIYDYESKEQIYQKDNLKNQLIIECNGDRTKAEELYKKQELVFNEDIDLLTLLSNIIINNELYKVSTETQKMALALVKNHIIKAIEERNSKIDSNEINITINDFQTKTKDGTNRNETSSDLNNYLASKFISDDKDLILTLLIINIIGVIGISFTFNNKILSTLLIVILIIGNIILFVKLNNRSKIRNQSKNQLKNNINSILERVLAETVDYLNIMKDDKVHLNELLVYLNSLNETNYIKSNNERNIEVEVN